MVERYLARSVSWPGALLEDQLAGQRAISILQRETVAPPKIGQVLVLTMNEGQASEVEQYVRVTRVSEVIRQFTITASGGNLDFTRKVVTCEISDPLKATFKGESPSPFDLGTGKQTQVRETIVANAARYYGASPLTVAGEPGQFKVRAASVYSQLVPSAQIETALTNIQAGGNTDPVLAASNGELTLNIAAPIAPSAVLYLGIYVPGSVSIQFGAQTMLSDGEHLTLNGTLVAALDYRGGRIVFNANAPSWSGSKTVKWVVGSVFTRVSSTDIHDVTAETRSLRFVKTLETVPAPGSLIFSYRVQDRWIDLRDNGMGELSASDPAFGAGRIDYGTGLIDITMGALPDVGTALLMAWGASVNSFKRAALPDVSAEVTLQMPLNGKRAAPGTVSMGWTGPGGIFSVTDNSLGVLGGDGAGTVDYLTGEIRLQPASLPAQGQDYAVECNLYSPAVAVSFDVTSSGAPTAVGGYWVFDTSLAQSGTVRPLIPGSFHTVIRCVNTLPTEGLGVPTSTLVGIKDDGQGNVRTSPGVFASGPIVGDINYTTGLVRISQTTTLSLLHQVYDHRPSTEAGYQRAYVDAASYDPTAVTVDVSDQAALQFAVPGLVDEPDGTVDANLSGEAGIALPLRDGEHILPGSLNLKLAGLTLLDRNGILFKDMNPATGIGVACGTVDYHTGRVVMSEAAGAASVTIDAMMTQAGTPVTGGMDFRIPLAPIRPASLQISYPVSGGSGTLSVTADSNGNLIGTGIRGQVDVQTGIVRLLFGRMVNRSQAIEAESWYDPASNDASNKTWKPELLDPTSLRYNAVAYTYLPLSADLLGLDPVRLPSDGRVPIFRAEDVVSIHHTARLAFPSPTAGAVLNVGRVRLAECRVVDSTGKYLDASLYETDLDAGTVRLATQLNLAGYTAPLFAEHRVEDIALCNEVQINGDLSLLRPLTHAYPAGESFVSSCLETGDLQARISPPFSQQTWTNVWSDARIGSPIAAQYQASTYPILTGNLGAIQERWRITFTSSNDFTLTGEHVGQIATGSTASNFSPNNPVTGQPYFTLLALGWGGGWQAGNVLRFNTQAAMYPLWLARSVGMGPATEHQDQFRLRLIGSVDA